MYKKFEVIKKKAIGLFTNSQVKKLDTKEMASSSPPEQKGKDEGDTKVLLDSATKIQAFARGFLARKAYGIRQLPKQELQLYPILIKGNDPELSKEQASELPRHHKGEKIALIGTSGMRSVEFACQLSAGIPKLIILDNSIQVTLFWRKTREIIAEATNQADFLKALETYISQDCDKLDLTLYPFGHRSSKKLNKPSHTIEEFAYLEYLFNKYGFERIKEIISNMSIIKQSWADKDVLVKIKNILTYSDITTIYAYPSNIVAYMNDDREEAEKILQNIQLLNPEIAFHTDSVYFNGEGSRPEKFYFVPKGKHDPERVRKVLKIEGTLEDPSFKLRV
ncbi:IQ calmodulin-binding motif-containing protein [Legionella sp. CNM-1927-20]|uniref:IQ calmodulin-binding motif-containing protein n=1 Tax=Legionella sp. CNM-1927-20 TaxID=3422221 RepID=UPI00403ADF68